MAKWILAVSLLLVPVVVVGGIVGSDVGMLPAPDDELWNSLVWQGWLAWLVLYLMAAVWAAKDAFGMLRQRDLDGHRDRAISTTFLTVNVILHLIFIVDIVSTLMVAHRAKQVLAHLS